MGLGGGLPEKLPRTCVLLMSRYSIGESRALRNYVVGGILRPARRVPHTYLPNNIGK